MFLDLPNELICLIAEELPRQHDRYNLVLSCRRMHTALLPTLYSRVCLCDRDPRHLAGQLSRFFNTIAQNPALANAVRYLSLNNWDPYNAGFEVDCEFDYDEELIDGLVAGTIWSDQPKEQLQLGNVDAWLALLISQMKCLRKIEIA